MLFHYTDAAGLLGIVRKRALWASDVEFLNDAQELQFGRPQLHTALLKEALRVDDLEDPYGAAASRASVIRNAAAHLDPGGLFARKVWHAVFVTCFCDGDDVLSQWRGYAGGRGFALGFARDMLLE